MTFSQCTKKVLSDSLGLLDFIVGLVDCSWEKFEEISITEVLYCKR